MDRPRPSVRMLAGGRASGGSAYESLAADALAEEFDVARPSLPSSPLRRLARLARLRGEADVWIRDYASTVTSQVDATRGADVSILHHIDNSVKPFARRMASGALDVAWRRALRRMDLVVTVSDHWRAVAEGLGAARVATIHNAFDFRQFDVGPQEVEAFRGRHGLAGPVVYLGNCQRAKGVVESWKALRDLPATLVTSGRRAVDVPTLNLELGFRDYLCLLKASSVVVTMSLFEEGWCRTAHEAMLLGTPVVGSGRGGMRELLEGGRQTVCPDFAGLRQAVEAAMADPGQGARGRAFAAQPQFTLEHFGGRWRDVVRDVVRAR